MWCQTDKTERKAQKRIFRQRRQDGDGRKSTQTKTAQELVWKNLMMTNESFDEFFQKYFDLSDDELVKMAKNALDMDGAMLVELHEFMIRRAERLEQKDVQKTSPPDN